MQWCDDSFFAWLIVVIKWLNKQINEQAIGRGTTRLPVELPSSIRPSPPAAYAGVSGFSTFHPSTQVNVMGACQSIGFNL